MTDRPYIPGYGPHTPKILILGESPTVKDLSSGQPFTDSRDLDTLLREVGINKNSCWLTYVFKHPIPPHPRIYNKPIPAYVRAKNDGLDLEQTIIELQNEINSIKPNIIIGIGGTALWALTGKKNIIEQRGSIISGLGTKAICTYNPNHLNFNVPGAEFVGYYNKVVIKLDLKRALEESEHADFRSIPIRNLQVIKSSYELEQFISMYKSHTKMGTDIEASGTCIPVCVGLSFSKSHGVTIPLWNTGGISSIHTEDLARLWQMLSRLLYEKEIVGQNFNYDRDKLKRLGLIIRFLKSDTMMKSFAINPELPKGLAFNTSIWTKEPWYKNEGMYHGSMESLFLGCARDACVTLEIDEAMESDLIEIGQHKFYYNFLMKLPEFYHDIENQGFRVDIKAKELLLQKYVSWSERLQYEIFQLTGEEINTNSPKQVAVLLFEVLKCPKRKGTSEEELTDLLNLQSFTDPSKRRICELILEKRRVDKSIGTYLMALTDYDGRMRTTYFPCLKTGRSKTGLQEEPIRPALEIRDAQNKKKNKSMGVAFQTMTKHGDIGQDIRSMYIPDIILTDPNVKEGEEEVFVQADSAQAEARVVFLLANDYEALEAIDKHDYHALTTSWFFGGTESDYSKATLGYESPHRFVGKTLRHAGHLGAAKRRAASEVNTSARKFKISIKITEADADKALKIFHGRQPKIRSIFHNGIYDAVNSTRRLTAGLPYGIDAECGGIRTFYERIGDELNRESLSYIPQRSVSDNTKAAGLRIKEKIPNIKIVMESHDALLFSIRKKDLDTICPIIKQEMERPISFHKCTLPRGYLKIPCEIEIGENYEKLKKFKFAFREEVSQLSVRIEEPTVKKSMIVGR